MARRRQGSVFRAASWTPSVPFFSQQRRQLAAVRRRPAAPALAEAPRRTEKRERNEGEKRKEERKREREKIANCFSSMPIRNHLPNSTTSLSRAMPPSPAPSSELAAAEEQKEKAVVEQTTSAIEFDQDEPIEEDEEAEDVDEADEEEEEGEAADATTAAAPGDETAAATAAAGLDFDLPRSILRRIVKARLSEVSAQELGEGKEFGVSKEALEALGEGAKVRRGGRGRGRDGGRSSFSSPSFRNPHLFFPQRALCTYLL